MQNMVEKTRRFRTRAVILAGMALMLWAAACETSVGPETQAVMYAITITKPTNGTVSADRTTARADEIITLTITPKVGYKLTSIRVTGLWDITLDGSGSTRTFAMPAEDVTVKAVFAAVKTDPTDPTDPVDPPDPVAYGITINAMSDGAFESFPADTQYENSLVRLIALPGRGKLYHPGSLRVTGVDSQRTIRITPVENSDTEWTFEMPSEDVEVDAAFMDEETVLYGLNIAQTVNGRIECGQTVAVAGDTVMLTLLPQDERYRYRNGTLTVTPELDLTDRGESGGSRVWTFTMTEETVSITAEFEEIPLYAVIPASAENGAIENGTITIEPSGRVRAGTELTITLAVTDPDNYRYKNGSIQVAYEGGTLHTTAGEGELQWKFTMPEEETAADVTVSAIFEEIPAYAISVPHWGTNGAITVSPVFGLNMVREGKPVTVTLTIADPANYRYVEGSFGITKTNGSGAVRFTANGIFRWTFTMPAEGVTINARIEFIPYFDIVLDGGAGGGNFSITGVETTGLYAGKAREGKPITVSATPHSGYKLEGGGLSVMPEGAVTLNKAEDQPVWTFNMPDTDLEIVIEFAELGPLEIYKGGARRGITVGELSDDKKYYENSVDMNAEGPGHNDSQRAIKITHAANAKGNAVQQSFGLFSDTEIDLENVTALSFWAKANKQLNIRYVGFGDADPDKRVVYTGENFNQQIPVGAEWKRYVIPVPASRSGQKTTRPFFFNASLTIGNYVYIDDIEFIESGVTVTEITIPDTYDSLFYGATDAVKMFKGIPTKLVYACDDGTITTLQGASNSHTLKYNLNHWLIPFIEVSGNVDFMNGVIIPNEKSTVTRFVVSVNIAGTRSNPMTAHITDGLLLDDFEGTWSGTIPATPTDTSGYIWHNNASGSVAAKDYITAANDEIYGGLSAGFWRPTADAKDPRGGRNFDAKDATGYNTLVFRIRVTAGTAVSSNFQKNTVFTFALKNNGTLTNKNNGNFFAQQFTYNTDGWQEVKMKLSDFVDAGLDSSAITGYAFSVVDNQGVALRIAFDDIVLGIDETD